MFSVTTGEQTRILKAHTDKVSQVLINPGNPLQLFSFGYDRMAMLWDYNDAILLSTHDLKFPVMRLAADPKNPSCVYVVTSYKHYFADDRDAYANKKHFLIFSLNLKTFEKKFVYDVSSFNQLLVAPEGEFIITRFNKSFGVIDLTSNPPQMTKFEHALHLQVLAVHPKQQFIAAGNERGEIIFYHCFAKDKNTGVTTIVADAITSRQHWHANAVTALEFDAEGAHMFSGGQEMVLVVWQLGTGRRDFLPRLGATITGITISPDQTLIALRLSDNSVKVVNARSRELEVMVEGVVIRRPVRTGMVMEPRNHGVAFGSLDGMMQMFSVTDDRSLGRLQVAPRNPVKQFDETKIHGSQVDYLTFSRNGDWLVTADRRPGAHSSALKFWALSPHATPTRGANSQPNYDLNTQVMNPHSEKITSLAYHPSLDMCVTTSPDGKFKIWVLVEREEQQSQPAAGALSVSPINSTGSRLSDMCWACRSVGFYRDLEATAAAFSPDGSVLAVAYQHIITLWNPLTNTLLSTLSYAAPYEKIRRLNFLSQGSELIACTDFNIYVWDLLSSKVKWSHYARVRDLAVDPASRRFAVVASHPNKATQESLIVMWASPDQPKPELVWRSASSVLSLAFQPIAARGSSAASSSPASKSASSRKSGQISHLVYLSSADEFYVLEPVTAAQKEALARKQKRTERVSIQSLLEAQQRDLNAKTLTEGPSVFKQIFGDPDTVLEMNNMDVDAPEESASSSAPTMMPKIKSSKPKKISGGPTANPFTTKMVERFLAQLDAPSHALPPPSALFSQFAETLATVPVPADSATAAVGADASSKKPKTAASAATNASAQSETSTNNNTNSNNNGEIFNEAKLLEKEASSHHMMTFMKEIFSFSNGVANATTKQHQHSLPESTKEVAVPEFLLRRIGSISLEQQQAEAVSTTTQLALEPAAAAAAAAEPAPQAVVAASPVTPAKTPSKKKQQQQQQEAPSTPSAAAAATAAPSTPKQDSSKKKRPDQQPPKTPATPVNTPMKSGDKVAQQQPQTPKTPQSVSKQQQQDSASKGGARQKRKRLSGGGGGANDVE